MNIIKYEDIICNIQRNNRKTVSIYVEPNGEINVLAPKEISKADLTNIIRNKQFWIYKSLLELEEMNEIKVNREIVDGESFLYLGKNYKLKIMKNRIRPLTLRQGRFYLDLKYQNMARDHFKNFYKEKGMQHLSQRVDYFKKKLEVSPNRIRVIELKNRWGSCTEKNLNFHWKVVLAPFKIIDYIVVHEMAHLIEPKHNDRFWEIIELVLPDYKKSKEWLKINGANLDI